MSRATTVVEGVGKHKQSCIAAPIDVAKTMVSQKIGQRVSLFPHSSRFASPGAVGNVFRTIGEGGDRVWSRNEYANSFGIFLCPVASRISDNSLWSHSLRSIQDKESPHESTNEFKALRQRNGSL